MFGFPIEILLAIGSLFAVVISYVAGGRSAKNKADAERAERDLDAMKKRKELDDELESLDPATRRERLDKWVRQAK